MFPQYECITLKAGFELFHVSYRNMGPNHNYTDPEAVNDFGSTPIGCLDMDHSLSFPKFFGILESFPYVHCLRTSPEMGLSKYTTHNHITLAMLETLRYPDEEFMNHLKETCDGWLRYDEPNNLWYECYLFEPRKHVGVGIEIAPNFNDLEFGGSYPLSLRLAELQKLHHFKV